MTVKEMRAEDEGATAAWDGYKVKDNPYSPADDEHSAWTRGHERGTREILIEQDCGRVDDECHAAMYD